ncbi:MAG: ATP synthase F1 subunit delta, partial [Caldilineaceae bacterium]|nr:ATP synthase F1 subunit delta [Caldilineaceae bacterium]
MSDKRARADRYAQAVLQAMVERWQGALNKVTDAVAQDQTLAALLKDSGKSAEAKAKALAAVLPGDTPAEILNLVMLVAQEQDLDLLPEISSALAENASGQNAPVKAEVVSAGELSGAEQEQIRQSLIAQHGDGLVFSFRVDPSLMGGLRVRV